jgi:predicted transcriptional regulator
MKSILVFQTSNGYAVVPYAGAIPAESLGEMKIATKIDKSYSSGSISLADVLEDYFEPEEAPEVTSLKVA